MTTPANKQLEQSQVGNSTRNFYFYGSAIILIVVEEKSQRKRYYYIYLLAHTIFKRVRFWQLPSPHFARGRHKDLLGAVLSKSIVVVAVVVPLLLLTHPFFLLTC